MYQMQQVMALWDLDPEETVSIAPFGVSADICPIFRAEELVKLACVRTITVLDATGGNLDNPLWRACRVWLDANVERFSVDQDDLHDAINAELAPPEILEMTECGPVLHVPWTRHQLEMLCEELMILDEMRTAPFCSPGEYLERHIA